MTTMDATNTSALLDSVREMRGVIAEHRDECDRLRRRPDAIAEGFIERNLFRMLLPGDYGGLAAVDDGGMPAASGSPSQPLSPLF